MFQPHQPVSVPGVMKMMGGTEHSLGSPMVPAAYALLEEKVSGHLIYLGVPNSVKLYAKTYSKQ